MRLKIEMELEVDDAAAQEYLAAFCNKNITVEHAAEFMVKCSILIGLDKGIATDPDLPDPYDIIKCSVTTIK